MHSNLVMSTDIILLSPSLYSQLGPLTHHRLCALRKAVGVAGGDIDGFNMQTVITEIKSASAKSPKPYFLLKKNHAPLIQKMALAGTAQSSEDNRTKEQVQAELNSIQQAFLQTGNANKARTSLKTDLAFLQHCSSAEFKPIIEQLEKVERGLTSSRCDYSPKITCCSSCLVFVFHIVQSCLNVDCFGVDYLTLTT